MAVLVFRHDFHKRAELRRLAYTLSLISALTEGQASQPATTALPEEIIRVT